MKVKFIRYFILQLLLLCAVNSYAYEEYWGDTNDRNRIVRHEMLTHPVLSGYENVSARVLSGNSLNVSFSIDMQWLNYRRVAATTSFQRTALVQEIQYRYKIGYKDGSSVKWLSDSDKLHTLDVKRNDDDPGYSNVIRRYYSKARNWTIDVSEDVDISELSTDKTYQIVVQFEAKITKVFERCRGTYTEMYGVYLQNNEEWYRWQSITLSRDASGNLVTIKKTKTDTPYLLNDERVNPKGMANSSVKYLVYNHAEAQIDLRLMQKGLDATKIKGSTIYYPFSALVAGDGLISPLPTTLKIAFSSNGCSSIHCDGKVNEDNPVYYLYDRKNEAKYLQSLGETVTIGTSRLRFSNLVTLPDVNYLRYDNSIISLHDDGYINSDGSASNGSSEYWVQWRLSLRQLQDSAGRSRLNGKNFTLQNVNAYFNQTMRTYCLKDVMWRSLGYELYGPTTSRTIPMFSSSASAEMFPKSNNLFFEIIPAAAIPALSDSEKAVRKTCARKVSDSLLRVQSAEELIILHAKKVDFGSYSASLYKPVHDWEVSYDKVHWESVKTSSKFGRYRQNFSDLDFASVFDDSTDIALSTEILNNADTLYFRQAVILKTFSSDLQSNLYSYKGSDGRWYIKVVSDTYYSYVSYNNLQMRVYATDAEGQRFEYSGENLCSGSQPNARKIEWEAAGLEETAEYRLYKLENNAVSELLTDNDQYSLPLIIDKTCNYRAVIKFCNDSVYRDFSIEVSEKPQIPFSQISSTSIISDVDSINKYITIKIYSSDKLNIAFDNYNYPTYNYYWRKVVEYQEPELESENFSSYSFDDCEVYIRAKGWNYLEDTGTSIETSTLAMLRQYCSQKSADENAQKLQNYISGYNEAVKWNATNGAANVSLKLNAEGESLFYIYKQNLETLCVSDSVLIKAVRVDEIANNTIAFADAAYADLNSLNVDENAPMPKIESYVVSGGYGIPNGTNSYSYIYQWIYRYTNGVWQNLSGAKYTDSGKSSVTNRMVSLLNGSTVIDRTMEIARVVISQSNSDESTQICDTSNVLKIYAESGINSNFVKVTGNGSCAGETIKIEYTEDIDFTKHSLSWTADDESVVIEKDEENPAVCYFSGAKDSFTAYVSRFNLETQSSSDEIAIPIEVISVYAWFSIKSGDNEYNILDYPDEDFVFTPGSLLQLENESVGSDLLYTWTLQVQQWLDDEVDGTQSALENPYCYIYNQGQNKLKLKVVGYSPDRSKKCTSEITAENIYVSGPATLRNLPVQSAFVENAGELQAALQSENISVYPTIINREQRRVNLSSNVQNLQYSLYDATGAPLLSGSFEYMGSIDVPHSNSKLLLLVVNSQTFKILNQ